MFTIDTGTETEQSGYLYRDWATGIPVPNLWYMYMYLNI